MMQGELKVDRTTNGQECRCCGLLIWKLTKTLVLAKIARGARAEFKRTDGPVAPSLGQREHRVTALSEQRTGMERRCGLETTP